MNPTDVVTVVTGLPRCGSSLLMRMLALGGVPIVGDPLSGEDMRSADEPLSPEFIAECRGRAVKVLDPHVHRPPASFEYRFIWLTRDSIEQARSMRKFMQWIGLSAEALPKRRVLTREIGVDTKRAIGVLGRLGPVLRSVSFESLILDPALSAERVAEFLGRSLNVAAMAAEVEPRSTRCLDVMLEDLQAATSENGGGA